MNAVALSVNPGTLIEPAICPFDNDTVCVRTSDSCLYGSCMDGTTHGGDCTGTHPSENGVLPCNLKAAHDWLGLLPLISCLGTTDREITPVDVGRPYRLGAVVVPL